MVLVQKWPFFQLSFLGDIEQEKVYYDILKEKKAFLGYTTRRSKSRKFKIFAKWLGHCFGPKLAIFPSFYFRQYRPGKCVLRYCRTRKRLSRLWKQEAQTVEKLRFLIFLFLSNIGNKNVLYDILKRKNVFLSYKNKKFEKSKNWHFSKGVNPWFLFKNGHFSNFFF